jgi:hypothetical protein
MSCCGMHVEVNIDEYNSDFHHPACDDRQWYKTCTNYRNVQHTIAFMAMQMSKAFKGYVLELSGIRRCPF